MTDPIERACDELALVGNDRYPVRMFARWLAKQGLSPDVLDRLLSGEMVAVPNDGSHHFTTDAVGRTKPWDAEQKERLRHARKSGVFDKSEQPEL